MSENKGYAGGDEGGLDEKEMKIAKERKEEEEGDIDLLGGGKGCQSDKKEEDPVLKDSDADFEDLEQEGGGGNSLGDGLERLWTGLGGILSRHSRWVTIAMLSSCNVIIIVIFIFMLSSNASWTYRAPLKPQQVGNHWSARTKYDCIKFICTILSSSLSLQSLSKTMSSSS